MDRTPLPPDVAKFLHDRIDTVPELEALLLFQDDASVRWTAEELSGRLYVGVRESSAIMSKLARLGLIVRAEGDAYRFEQSIPEAGLVRRVAETYQKHLSLITRIIHNKPAFAVREFAQAFNMKKREE